MDGKDCRLGPLWKRPKQRQTPKKSSVPNQHPAYHATYSCSVNCVHCFGWRSCRKRAPGAGNYPCHHLTHVRTKLHVVFGFTAPKRVLDKFTRQHLTAHNLVPIAPTLGFTLK